MTEIDNPFAYDADQLTAIATEEAYHTGLKYYREDRVMEAFIQEECLMALVEEDRQEQPYSIELSHDQKGTLYFYCDCGSSVVCEHVVAALLTQNDARPDEENAGLASAMETAIAERVKRGQTEVTVKHQSGHPWFGIWQAHTVAKDGPWQRHYEVHLRSLTERINFCTCPDRANNQLGTCKHIEAVLHKLRKKRKKRDGDVLTAAALPFIYLDSRNDDRIRLRRTADMPSSLAEVVDAYFDAQGDFTGTLPEDFFHLCDRLQGDDRIAIGLDARRDVERLAARQAQQWRAGRIRQQIMETDGRLPGVKAKLYPYQVEGVAFLAANGRALLADDMGLGKTLQAIAAGTWLIHHAGVRRALILCPASLKHQWAREIERFTGQAVQVIQGNAEQRQAQYRQDCPWFIVNYELLLRDLSVINERIRPDLMILDEAQRIKNWRTRIATAVKQVNSRFAFVLTGTPLENRLEDLYSLMQVVDQHLLGPLWRYLNDYHILDDTGKVQGYRNLSQLRERIAPVMLRRNRAIVSHQLPARSTTRLDVPMTDRQRELHDAALAQAGRLATVAKRRPLTPTERNRLMAALQHARMACDAAGLVDRTTEGSPKLNELKTLVRELCLDGGRKMVVFSQWREMTLRVKAMLDSLGVGSVHLHGQVPTAKRGDLLARFANDDSIQVFLSTDAGGTGLNLQAASVLVNLDIPWNPAVLEQRNARVHRLGQSEPVQIFLMVAEASYEQRVLSMLGTKQDLFDNVIEEDATGDLVGVSTRSLAAMIEDLNDPTHPVTRQQDAAQTEDVQTEDDASLKAETPDTAGLEALADAGTQALMEEDRKLQQGLADLHRHFGDRLSSVQARGGGLLLVLDQVQPADESWVDALALPVPIALIDERTRSQLQRLGSDMLVEPPMGPGSPQPPHWQRQAQEKLAAARLLLEQGHAAGVMDLLSAVLSAWAADLAGQSDPQPPESLAVWLYAEALPQSLVDDRQAATAARLLGLRQAGSIPEPLLVQLVQDMSALIGADLEAVRD